jgi:hypothetical protein
MSLMSNATPAPAATEAPAKEGAPEGASPDPKANGSPAAAPKPGEASGGDPSNTSGESTATNTDQAASPSKAQQAFEAKLEELAEADLSIKQRAREVEKAEAKLRADEARSARYGELDDHMSKGEVRAAVKKFLGEKYTPDLLLELADDFAPGAEISVEERVERKLAEQKKKDEEAEQKKRDEQAAAAKTALETETKAYLSATADYLREHKDQYPLICAWDDDEDIDHERIIDKIWRSHFAKTGEVLDPDKVLEQVEARHLARIKKTAFGPKEPAKEPSRDDLPFDSLIRGQQPAPAPTNGRSKTGVEEAYENLDAYERDKKQRELLSYGR